MKKCAQDHIYILTVILSNAAKGLKHARDGVMVVTNATVRRTLVVIN